MKNEVYGTITLSVSMGTNANSEDLAKLEAGYKVNGYNFRNELLGNMTVHNVDVDWERFFGDDE